ncbi:hypothetical protein SAOR_16240 [Salinisphaera orenii MK-B5]|uniref:Uncharacterized protein n=1 Tax=Salinisphaera orenii MK-B5 TaxID=856730 RepID=A0A423PES2_9GAMM|nr:hypothetical protein SAOR_16240 [Salinisphaera orenii MK-B5]
MNVYFYEAAAAEFGDAVDYYDQQLRAWADGFAKRWLKP